MYRLPPGARNRLHLGARSSKLPFVGVGGILLYRQGHRPRPQLLTFDDGYADHLFDALPLLERYDIPAAYFIMTGFVDGDRETWRDRLEQAVFATPEWPSARELEVEGKAIVWTRPAGAVHHAARHALHPSFWQQLGTEPRLCGRATVRPARPSCARSPHTPRSPSGRIPVPPAIGAAERQREEFASGKATSASWLGRSIDLVAYLLTTGPRVVPHRFDLFRI